MKLSPKGVKFCPGCPNKKLSLTEAPQIAFKMEAPKQTKIITLTSKKTSKKTNSLF